MVNTNASKTRKLTTMALLTAISVALIWVARFIPFFSMAFLEYEPSQIPILIGAFAYGPVAGLLLTVVAALIQGFTVSAQSGPYGILMHIIATGTYVLVAGTIYKYKKTMGGAVVALIAGTIAMTVMMIGANLLITPYYMNSTREFVAGFLLPVIIPFNLLKAGINGIVTMVLYKSCSNLIHGRAGKSIKGAGSKA